MMPYWSSVSPKCSTVGCPDAENTENTEKRCTQRGESTSHTGVGGKQKPWEFTNVGDSPMVV